MLKAIKIVLILLLISNNIFGQIITRGPYLQQVTSSSIIVRWRTDLPTDSKINFGQSLNSKSNSAKDTENTTEHILKLDGLKPDSQYFYEIIINNVVFGNSNQYFLTAPNSDSKKPIHIWAGGDFADLSNEVYKTNQTQVRDSYLNYSKNFETNLWLWLGDVGYGGNRDVQLQTSIFDFYGEKILPKIPFSAVLGNHEFDEDPINQQKTRDVHLLKITSPPTNAEGGGIASNTKAYYSYNYGNTHFIALDSYGMDNGLYRIYDTNSAQYQWLIKDLEANKSMWTIVFFHHPPYTKRAHDSDTETELRLLRETLVPVFDKYKVDLVLNGHSHIYERSYLIQGHYGGSDTFNANTQIVNKASGKYLKNELPIINKTNGTMYVVSGTFGRLEPILAIRLGDAPHPTSYYSNLLTGGSLALKIEDNRLDCEWLCADGVVRDRFTLFKDVNKTTKLSIEYGDKIKLKASWPGTYIWNTGKKNQQEIEISPLASTNYTVSDSLGFLQDKFEITVAPQPVIVPKLPVNLIACAGRNIIGTADIKNTTFEKWKYTIQLSDANGSFSVPIVSQELTENQFVIKIPESTKEGSNYKLKIIPNSNLFNVQTSETFKVNLPAAGSFSNAAVLPFQPEIKLELNFKGTFPIEYSVDFLNLNQTTNQEKVEFLVKQIAAKSYEILSIKNVCNEGLLQNKKITVTAPLSTELENIGIKIYPNPVKEELILESKNKEIKSVIISDITGKYLIEKPLIIGKNIFNLKDLTDGSYLIKIENNGQIITNKFIKH